MKQAHKYLEQWLKARHGYIHQEISWNYWTYTEKPFWAAVISLDVCRGLIGFGYNYGFHIHEDGEVILIGRMDDANAK